VRLELALGLGRGTKGGAGRGLTLTSSGVARTRLHFSLASLSTSRGRVALLQANLVSPHAGRGLSTVTTRSKRCASSRDVPYIVGCQAHRCPTAFAAARGQDASPRGGQPRRLRSEQLEHRERWSRGSTPPIRAAEAHLTLPLSLCGLEPF
jgi:hypothetical protein